MRPVILAVTLACCAAAQAAPPVTAEELKARRVDIEARYGQAQTRCQRAEGHGRELCDQQARSERAIRLAELEMQARPTPGNEQKLRQAKAEGAYATAMVNCKSLLGAARKVCREDARAVLESALGGPRLPRDPVEQALRLGEPAREPSTQAERIAAAQFSAAREHCEMLPGEARGACLAEARQRFGRF
jgi:hypothetical protein